ncbi:rho guanine nucleotide exchange factor 18-like [Conger conger]|uniref:rho guanine nucleotide exchange factor 18-like n=1 Tax=Conger conger TaxID=82655 RepID=UPI002A5A8FD3|nr:rho guanine nucleotide exchange factor 18-like [Conger conger]XP_061096987.1 rho guanine nucleotide exchange factor 18-like [Conger conger]XP_061096988.1 rho guanine nucleotide exchange factor 18-like [Conger conger]
MDEVDALRIKSLSNDILSPPSDTESAPQEGDSSALEAELWSRAVGAQKEAIKRQDVIYEWLQLKDAQVAQAVSERMLVLGELSGLEPPPLLPQGEPLLQAAVADVETLQAFLLGGLREEVWKNVCDEEGGATEGVAMDKSLTSDPQLTGLSGTDVLEQPVEENTLSSWDQSDSFPVAQFFDRVLKLSQRLYTLQVVVLQQESHVELQRAAVLGGGAGLGGGALLEQERQRNLERRREELAGFQRERGGFREEQERWEQERGGRERELQAREEALQSREEERLQREARLREAQAQLEEHRQQYQQDLERLRDATRATERERERLERLTTLRNKSSPALLSSQPSQAVPHSHLCNVDTGPPFLCPPPAPGPRPA